MVHYNQLSLPGHIMHMFGNCKVNLGIYSSHILVFGPYLL